VNGALLAWYEQHGRANLPWRRSRDPYRVLVSEFMLQQTQVDRVIPLFAAWLECFPSFAALAAAAPGDAIRQWRGLGYNSRALRLHALARAVMEQYGGRLPREREALLALPGIGPYTVAAIRAFAFDEDEVAFDTNLRRIVHRMRLGIEYPRQASDRELDALAREALPAGRAHDWNSAMMDLGATICTARAPKCLLCPLQTDCLAAPIDAPELARRAREHRAGAGVPAVPFERTTRYLRGRIVDALRDVPPGVSLALGELIALLEPIVPADRVVEIPAVASALIDEGLIEASATGLRLA
jgi:A/G-specific adenine glycosylase